MSAPRLEVDLGKIEHNARTMVERLAIRGISVTGVTKSILGSTEITSALLRAGITSLGDSRIENIESMHRADLNTPMTLIRAPMLSQVRRVVAHADISFNTELVTIRKLSAAAVAAGQSHGIVLMAELGDLREGILPEDMAEVIRETIDLPGIVIKGIGANLACRSGVAPDSTNMSVLSELADKQESIFGIHFDIISGGNSSNLDWALGDNQPGRINNLRLGESLLLGCEALQRNPIEGLYTDAITLVAEVIESKIKPSQPWGTVAQNAFGELSVARGQGDMMQSILAIGRQDIDLQGLAAPPGITIIEASSDHLMIQCDRLLAVGTELSFQINYGALLRAMTSPFIEKKYNRTQNLNLQQEEAIMSKGKDQKRNAKKKPLLTAKEKKAAKAAKRATTDFLSS